MERKPRQIRRKNRSANWIPAEKILLRKLVRPHLSIIENKRTDSETNQKKREAWNALCNSFNELSTIGIPRTVVNLKTQWCIMKMEQKRKRLAATWIIKRERPDTSTETLISIKQEKPDSSDETVLSEDLSIRKDVEVNSNRGPGPSQAALDYQMHNERKREELLNIQIKNEKTKMMILEHQLIYWKKRSSALVPPVPIIPIVPSVNTCMTLVSCCTTLSTTQACIPTVSTSQLQALHPPTVTTAMEAVNPVSNPVMNSLVSASTVILNDAIPNPIIPMASSNINIPAELPVSTLPVPILGLKAHDQENGDKSDDTMSDKPVQSPEGISDSLVNDSLESPSFIEQMNKKEKADMEDGDQIIVDDEKEFGHNGVMSIGETPPRLSPSRDAAEPLDADAPSDVNMADAASENGSMQVEPSHSPLSTDMMVEAADAADTQEDAQLAESSTALTTDDLMLLCELFYLPFEHGSRALRLLHDYHWLVSHPPPPPRSKPETSEWRRRRYRFAWWAWRARRLTRRLQLCANKELCAELYPYLWELCAVLTLLEGFVKWLELGKLPPNANLTPQGTYTWFSKGWREAFESGAQEPWVFRGGVTAELRRLVPVESSPEAARAARPPPRLPPSIVPYAPRHEQAVRELCHLTCRDGSDCTSLFPADLQDLPADRLIMPFLTLYPEYCMVVEETLEDPPAPDAPPPDEPKVIGYAVAAPDAREFYRRQEVAWIPELCNKYPKSLLERTDLSPAARECITELHLNSPVLPPAALRQHPALIQCSVGGAQPRLLVCLRAALAASGVTGAHVCINATDSLLHQFYGKLGFTELASEGPRVYLGRTF